MTVSEPNENKALDESTLATERILAAARCISDYVDQYLKGHQAFDSLKALATLTIARIEEGKGVSSFTAENIVAEAGIRLTNGKPAGTRLSPLWNKLVEQVLPERESGIQTFARNSGLDFYPWPGKDESRGGRPAQYFLTALPLPEEYQTPQKAIADGEVAYIPELTPEAAWWVRALLKKGYRLEGWRRLLFLAYGISIFIMIGLAAALALWILLGLAPALESKLIWMALAAAGFGLWAWLSPFIRLLNWRIVMAPTGLVALKEINVQMEIVRDAHAEKRSSLIRLVRYASTCPLCEARIEIVEGGKEFPNRLVGRCSENPAEHVYSFDRHTCRGRTLR